MSQLFSHGNIMVITGRNESSLVYMADGYARASGKTAVLLVTPGPGLGNIVSGCMEAYADNVPLLIIHIDTERSETGRGILHELKEPENIFRHFIKDSFSVSSPEEIGPALDNAYAASGTGRKGPVLVSVPYTFLEKDIPSPAVQETISAHTHPRPDTDDAPVRFHEIQKILESKEKPVIIGGKQLMFGDASMFLDRICTDSSIPFLTTTGGKGIVPENRAYAFGSIMQKGTVKQIIMDSDCVIALGTRLRDVDARRRGVKINDLIHIDIDSQWLNKNYPATCSMAGDMPCALQYLAETLKGKRFSWDLEQLRHRYNADLDSLNELSSGYRIMKSIRESVPENTITVWDLNLISYWAEYYFPVLKQNTFFMPRGTSPIFYAFPAGIGIKAAAPEKPCLCVCGDGSILPVLGELATICKYNLPLVVLIYNNNSFGILEDYMQSTYDIHNSMDLLNPDFVRLAASFGVKAGKAEDPDELKAILLKKTTWAEPFVIEFSYPVFPPPWRV